MKFDVEEVANGYTVKVGESEELHIAKNAKEVAGVIVKALGPQEGKALKAKKARKPRGPNKKKAATANAAALAGIV